SRNCAPLQDLRSAEHLDASAPRGRKKTGFASSSWAEGTGRRASGGRRAARTFTDSIEDETHGVYPPEGFGRRACRMRGYFADRDVFSQQTALRFGRAH